MNTNEHEWKNEPILGGDPNSGVVRVAKSKTNPFEYASWWRLAAAGLLVGGGKNEPIIRRGYWWRLGGFAIAYG
jgi:hypothetical protein